MLCHGRKSCADNPEPWRRDHRRKACARNDPRFHAGHNTDATERVPPWENRWRATVPRGRERIRHSMESHALSWPRQSSNGEPSSVMAANHAPTTRNLGDEITDAKHVPVTTPGSMLATTRTRRSASLQGNPRWAIGRDGARPSKGKPVEDHGPPWPFNSLGGSRSGRRSGRAAPCPGTSAGRHPRRG